jgi:hypothetical protein
MSKKPNMQPVKKGALAPKKSSPKPIKQEPNAKNNKVKSC